MLIDALRAGERGAFRSALSHLILPAIALGTIPLAVIARMTRSSMLEVLREDYVRTARAKGLPRWRVIVVHALRNALIPVITRDRAAGAACCCSGAILTETIFSWPGVGQLADPRRAVARLSGGAGRHPADRDDRHQRSNLHRRHCCYGVINPRIRHALSATATAVAAIADVERCRRVALARRSGTRMRKAAARSRSASTLRRRARCCSRWFADVVAPHPPNEQYREFTLTPPAWDARRQSRVPARHRSGRPRHLVAARSTARGCRC